MGLQIFLCFKKFKKIFFYKNTQQTISPITAIAAALKQWQVANVQDTMVDQRGIAKRALVLPRVEHNDTLVVQLPNMIQPQTGLDMEAVTEEEDGGDNQTRTAILLPFY